ncbi:Ribose import ATP-binding protein RbsA [bioreactor metagenome]|uniref:Ribose import ATP-binding protein RbsA n=1 Tax=bioreactor metagenome TaxID=1076179 RepID=A0A645JNB9_9ZZZZ
MLSVRENISVSTLETLQGAFGISKKKEMSLAEQVVADYDVRTSDLEKMIKFLSGGNQQKVIIGRAMCCNPKVLIFDEPTKGIDVGTKVQIYRMMKDLAEKEGIGIILISSEMEEIRKCSNRIIVLYQGQKIGEFPSGTEKETIMSAVIGIN